MLKSLLSNKKTIIILVCSLIFIVASYFVYQKYVTPRLMQKYVDNKEFTHQNENTDEMDKMSDLYFFYTSWCPHCKTAFPIWKELQTKNLKNINFIEVDCDEDTETADKFKIEGYPTIKLVKDNKIIEYDAKPDVDTLLRFIASAN